MRLYHGSNIAIDNINLAMCRPYKDFGQGFYLTDIEEQAEKMAIRVARIYGEKPIVNIYEIEDNFKDLHKLDIENPIIRINTAFKGCSSLEKISVLPRIYHN